jgi:vanillate O-demethylase monooxygenase subunit
MFMRNVWYMAAWCREIGEQPLGRVILNEPVVMFRGLNGELGALRDACPHRAVPLSMGTVKHGNIRCPYHGLEFDTKGVCRHNAHVKGPPDRIVDKVYPVVERYGMVWIWMGDAALADPDLIVDHSIMDDPDQFAVSTGYLNIKADYRLAIDNLMDLAHAEFLHPNTVGSPGSTEVEQVEVVVEDRSVTVNTLRPDLPPNAIDKVWWTKTPHVDQYLDMTWRPASNLFLDISITGPGEPRADGIRTPGAHILTPETDRSTHYFWAFGRDFDKDNTELSNIISQTIGTAFNAEDSPIIEAAQRMLDMTQMPLMNFTRGDAGSAHVRRALERLIKQEQAEKA